MSKTLKQPKQFRKWEHLVEQHCLMCNTPFITKIYWAFGGRNPQYDHWIIGSVYCSTKCSKKAHKLFRESD